MSDGAMKSVFPGPRFPGRMRCGENLRILVLSDLHLPIGESRLRALMDWRDFLAEHHWAVLLGDTTAYYGNNAEYSAVARLLHMFPLPYWPVNGNHEFSFVPVENEDARYGKLWNIADPDTMRRQLERFRNFFRLRSGFHAFHTTHADLLLLGTDAVDPVTTAGKLSPEHEFWLSEKLSASAARPLMIFCHFPLADIRLDQIRYYEPSRKPYYCPPDNIRLLLRRRKSPALWFSGHVHFNPPHPCATPYRTVDNVWQLHCPDGFGYGRRQDDWLPSRHDDFFVRSLHLTPASVTCRTFDIFRRCEVNDSLFKIEQEKKLSENSHLS